MDTIADTDDVPDPRTQVTASADDLSLRQIPDRFWPLLRTLADAGRAMHRRELSERVADMLGLSEAARELRIPSGKATTHSHRTGWALQHLKHAGLVRAESLGMWGLTDQGRAFVDQRPDGLSNADRSTLMRATGSTGAARQASPATADPVVPLAVPDDESTPDEQIARALAKLRASIAEQLLERLMAGTPAFFEHVVHDLLQKMGYGSARDDLRRSVGSGDGGIDGIMSLDRLGLEKVYVQAKRWQGNVGRPEIQSFFGALHGRHASKGVFITTSAFTREAQDYATSVSDTIVLVDGPALAGLMIEFAAGVTLRPVYLPEIDSDYFVDD